MKGHLATWPGCKMSRWPNARLVGWNCAGENSRLIIDVMSIGIFGIGYFLYRILGILVADILGVHTWYNSKLVIA